ncbi:MAG TPA: zinc ribbon domain-containing protein [Pyrinomonadaceae bacterium]|nr:zinc ribbon domain-containing protein [Pyrinomonadaceae bacterium]
MYCQSCGIAIDPAMRFCNRCGTSVLTPADAVEVKKSAKRLDDSLDGLFWITAFGVALTAGGMVLLKKTGFSDSFIVAFVILSATAFLINFVLNLWIVLGIVRQSKKALSQSQADTTGLEPMKSQPALHPASVTDNTTRSFEPIYNKRNSD